MRDFRRVIICCGLRRRRATVTVCSPDAADAATVRSERVERSLEVTAALPQCARRRVRVEAKANKHAHGVLRIRGKGVVEGNCRRNKR